MKKLVSLILALCLCASLAFTLVGCGAPEDDGAEIDIYLGDEVYDLDPTDYYVDSNAEQVMSLLFEPLFTYKNGQLQCAAAESYTVDRENREIIVKLRESYWSNNTRVKASDFVYTWSERLLNPSNPNPAAALLYDVENAAAIKSGVMSPAELMAEATDVYELTITYCEGADYNQILRNLASVATAPVKQSSVDTASTYWSKIITSIVTNGPFKVQRYDTTNSELVLARNKGYHQPYDIVNYVGQVTPGQLVGFTTAVGDKIELSYSDIENKTCFYLADASLADRAANKDKAVVSDDTSVYTYVFNTKKPLFAIPEVRRALSMAIDREAIVEAVVFGKAADGFIPDVSGGSSDVLIASVANISRAKSLISSVSLKGIDKTINLAVNKDEQSLAIAALVEASWEKLGFEVEIVEMTSVEFTVNNGSEEEEEEGVSSAVTFLDSEVQSTVKDIALGMCDFDVIAVDWQTYSDDAFVGLSALSSHMNGCGRVLPYGEARKSISGWSDANYDQLITSAYKAEGSDRAALLEAAEAYLCEQMPVCPIMFNQNFAFVSSELTGVEFDGFGNAIFTKAVQNNYKQYFKED